MIAGLHDMSRPFKKAVIFSVLFHALLFITIAVSPSLPKPAKKGMIHYVSLSFGGGGGGGGRGGAGGAAAVKQEPAAPVKKETLRDLTMAQKVEQPQESTFRHPVDKPQKDKKTAPEKKAVISKPQQSLPESLKTQAPAAETGSAGSSGSGSGLRIGVGEGPGGGGGGFGYGEPGGVSTFPFQYYLQLIMDRVSANWFTSLVDSGATGVFTATVYFRIYRSGQVSDLKIRESSGIQSLDLSAMRAVQTSAPFPALPNDYDGQYLAINLIFEHSK
jgi:TonB family protein